MLQDIDQNCRRCAHGFFGPFWLPDSPMGNSGFRDQSTIVHDPGCLGPGDEVEGSEAASEGEAEAKEAETEAKTESPRELVKVCRSAVGLQAPIDIYFASPSWP